MKRAEVAAGCRARARTEAWAPGAYGIELGETSGTVFARFAIQSSPLSEEEISATVPLPEPTNLPPPIVSDIAPVPSAEVCNRLRSADCLSPTRRPLPVG
jgi:hypothetical protein